MFKTIYIAITILCCASFAAAQSTDYKKIDFYAGLSLSGVVHSIGDDRLPDDPEEFNGFNTSITRNISRYAGLKFDFSLQQRAPYTSYIKRDSNLYNFLGGFQLQDNSSEKTFKPFVHALVGVAHIHNRFNFSNDYCIAISPSPCPANFTESDTAVAGVFGGGIDIRAGNRFDVRIIQVDYNPTKLFGSSQTNIRFGIGLVFH